MALKGEVCYRGEDLEFRERVDGLYKTVYLLEERKGRIEKKLYRGRGRSRLFLYEMVMSYREAF